MSEPVTTPTPDAEEDTARLPANAEDRKAAAALNALNANEISQGGSSNAAAKQPSKADQEALSNAMSRLEIASGAGAAKKVTGAGIGVGGGGEKMKVEGKEMGKKEVEVKKKVKIAAEDVTLLVSWNGGWEARGLG